MEEGKPKHSPWTFVALALLVLLVGLLVYGVAIETGGNKYDNAVAEGRRLPAPERQVRMLNDDKLVSLAEYRGKVVLLNFWASWCEPCKQEAPAIERAAQKYKDRDFVVIGANVDDLSKDANEFIIEHHLSYPNLRYSSTEATRDFGTRRMPETFVIDRDGKVAALKRMQIDDDWIESVLPPILDEPRGS